MSVPARLSVQQTLACTEGCTRIDFVTQTHAISSKSWCDHCFTPRAVVDEQAQPGESGIDKTATRLLPRSYNSNNQARRAKSRPAFHSILILYNDTSERGWPNAGVIR
jgi:hypothetical protein